MSLLKVNEVQNYNGSSLTLTASTVSTSAQLNTGGNISVTGSINVSDDSTTRSNLGLGSIATQASDNVTITGGNISNATLASSVTFPAGHIIQTVRNTKGGSSTSTTSTTFSKVQNSSAEYYSATINNVLANSKVFITTRFQGRFDNTSNNAGGEFGLYRDSTIILGQSTLSSPVNYYLHVGVTDTDYWVPQTITFLDESPATGTNIYYLGYSSYGSTSVQVLGFINFEMILMEIAE